VALDVYTHSSMETRRGAAEVLEASCRIRRKQTRLLASSAISVRLTALGEVHAGPLAIAKITSAIFSNSGAPLTRGLKYGSMYEMAISSSKWIAEPWGVFPLLIRNNHLFDSAPVRSLR
jgi:hypothetical protein